MSKPLAKTWKRREHFRLREQKRRDECKENGLCPQCKGPWIEPLLKHRVKPEHCRNCQDYYSYRYLKKKNPPDSELLRVIHRVMILSEKQITKPVLIDALSKKAKKHVLDILLERHGSWIKVRQLVGIIKKKPPKLERHLTGNRYSDEELLRVIREVAERFPGKHLTVWDYDSVRKTPSLKTINARFGSWAAACERAGVKTVPRSLMPTQDRYEYLRYKRYLLNNHLKATGRCEQCHKEWIPPITTPGKGAPAYCLNCQERVKEKIDSIKN